MYKKFIIIIIISLVPMILRIKFKIFILNCTQYSEKRTLTKLERRQTELSILLCLTNYLEAIGNKKLQLQHNKLVLRKSAEKAQSFFEAFDFCHDSILVFWCPKIMREIHE